MPTVSIYLPDEVFEQWKKDKKRKGVIAKLIAEHYGFMVNKSRVVINTEVTRVSEPMPHLAPPLIQQFKPRERIDD